jgi:ribosomal subunit interface protein
MNVQIRTKDITLTEQTKSHIEAAIEQFSKYSMEMTTINVILAKEKKGVSVEFDMHIAHSNPVVIKQEDGNLDAAIDIAIERANKALRRLHDKVTSHRGAGLKEAVLAEE